ncbi:MAG: carboxymuconolactone decarboxylase family protein [Deltaproteobacteria bacterium]|nr:carboxymuconolactone decarboxylase family protein [Deltaproteobacteria bacterium]MBW2362747.1 carboxymuconolactone decarboxylase family protein [Deltaproteobacteria bacterium]
MTNAERLRPLRPDEWSPGVREQLAGTRDSVAEMEGDRAHADAEEDASSTLNILCTIAHHPTLMGPFLGFASALAMRGVLSRRVSELLALRAAWNCRSAFEWGHHVVFARAAGLEPDEIQRIAVGPDHPDWSEEDRLLLRAADELHARQDLSESTWSGLRRQLSDAQLVEIPFVVGQYTMLSMVANATGVPVEAGLERLPDAAG